MYGGCVGPFIIKHIQSAKPELTYKRIIPNKHSETNFSVNVDRALLFVMDGLPLLALILTLGEIWRQNCSPSLLLNCYFASSGVKPCWEKHAFSLLCGLSLIFLVPLRMSHTFRNLMSCFWVSDGNLRVTVYCLIAVFKADVFYHWVKVAFCSPAIVGASMAWQKTPLWSWGCAIIHHVAAGSVPSLHATEHNAYMSRQCTGSELPIASQSLDISGCINTINLKHI